MKTTYYFMALVCAILSLFTASCSEDEDPVLEVTGEKEFIFSVSGGEFTVNINSNVDYEVILPQVEWISQRTSATNLSHTFNVLPNETYDSRTATIEFRDKNSLLKASVQISQSCESVLIVEKEVYVENWEAHVLALKVQSNVDFEIKTTDSWISCVDSRGLSERTVKLKLEANDSGEIRETIIKLVGESVEQNITIRQEGNEERNILVSLYQSTGGDNWIRKENWCSDKPLNQWEGVRTTSEGHVYYLDFAEHKDGFLTGVGNNLNGNFKLNGLKHLTNLILSNNSISKLELSDLPNLETLLVEYVPLEEMILHDLPTLKRLDCAENSFRHVDLRDLKSLERIVLLNERNLESFNIEGLTNLKEIGIPYCRKLSGILDLTNYENMEKLWCYGCNFSSIKVAGLKEMKNINVAINKLTEFDVSGLEKLETLSINSNQISKIDVSDLKNIHILGIANNPISDIDLTNNTNIISLSTRFCQLTKLDLNHLSQLREVLCDGNQITELNVNKLNLTCLWCDDNQIKELDLSGSTDITTKTGSSISNLNCENNPLEKVILPRSAIDYGVFTGWGENNGELYLKPEHREGYQYPLFFYVD